jgi:hypothetical protein
MRSVFWARAPKPGNVGDWVTPFLCERWKRSYRFGRPEHSGKVLGCGSIVRFAKPGDTILGSGIMRNSDPIEPEADYRWVRGPLTQQAVHRAGGRCPGIFGDPALLLPRVYTPTRLGGAGRGVVLHYRDWRDMSIRSRWPLDRLISPLTPYVDQFVDQLCRFDEIVSSSLHGMVIAHAYGIPARWVRFSDRVNGGAVKFHDYLYGIGQAPYNPDWPTGRIEPTNVDVDLNRLEKLWKEAFPTPTR